MAFVCETELDLYYISPLFQQSLQSLKRSQTHWASDTRFRLCLLQDRSSNTSILLLLMQTTVMWGLDWLHFDMGRSIDCLHCGLTTNHNLGCLSSDREQRLRLGA